MKYFLQTAIPSETNSLTLGELKSSNMIGFTQRLLADLFELFLTYLGLKSTLAIEMRMGINGVA